MLRESVEENYENRFNYVEWGTLDDGSIYYRILEYDGLNFR